MYGGIRLMYKFLLVEDSLSDVEAFQTTIKRMNRGNGQTIYELVIAESVDKAMEMIDSTYNGAIIDINLGEHSGNEVIHMIDNRKIKSTYCYIYRNSRYKCGFIRNSYLQKR